MVEGSGRRTTGSTAASGASSGSSAAGASTTSASLTMTVSRDSAAGGSLASLTSIGSRAAGAIGSLVSLVATGSRAAGAIGSLVSLVATGSRAAGAGGSLGSVVAAAIVSAGSSAIVTPAACSDAWSSTEAGASISGVVPPVCSSVKMMVSYGWSSPGIARRLEPRSSRLVDQQSGGFVRSVHSFDQAMGRLLTCLARGPRESSTRVQGQQLLAALTGSLRMTADPGRTSSVQSARA